MPNEHGELTEQELLDLAVANPRVAKAIQDADPRSKLYELLYNSDKKYGDKPFREVIEEMGVQIAPDSQLSRARRHARAEIDPLVSEVRALRDDLAKEKKTVERQTWRERLREHAERAGAKTTDEELDKIETFMSENHYGPKAAAKAVEAYVETAYPAEPNFESEQTFTLGDADDAHVKELLKLGPGDDLGPNTSRGIAHAERVYQDMFGATKHRSPAFTATP